MLCLGTLVVPESFPLSHDRVDESSAHAVIHMDDLYELQMLGN